MEILMTIGITGATGHLGRLAIAALKERAPDTEVVALVRNPAAAADLGVEVRLFNYHTAEASALAGLDVLVLISSNDLNDRTGQHLKVIAAAKAAGVKRLVYTSILKGDASPMLLAQDHIVTEAALKGSGLAYTILRNGWYTENYTGSLSGAVAAGAMIGSAENGQISSAARKDYAEAIAVTAAGAGHDNKIYELAGDTAFSMLEMAAEVSRVTGKTIPYNSLPMEEYAKILQSFGVPDGFALVLADCDVAASDGALLDDSGTLSRLIGHPTTPMVVSVAQALK
jgi:NAD(P)H dehydrogenase (quinone)